MEIQRLEAILAPAIVQLAEEVRGPEMAGSEADVMANLERAERRDHNYSLGLVDRSGHLRGYLIAWLQESLIRGSSELVLLVDDCCLERGMEAYFAQLLEALVAILPARQQTSLAIETVVTPEGLDLLADHDAEVSASGYALVGSHQYRDSHTGLDMTWLRYLLEARE